MTATGLPTLVCPLCRMPLERNESGSYRCQVCRRTYPEVAGIPDLRLSCDRYLSLDEDRAKAERLAELSDRTFAELVEAYWRMTPEVPADLAARYSREMIDAERRAEHWLTPVRDELGEQRLLEVGCGSGGLIAAAARRGAHVTGVDIALRWLIIARRRCEERALAAQFLAADGSAPPIPVGTFDATVCIATLEHTTDQRGLLQWCLLSVRAGGWVRIVTANRLSAAPDPVTGLLGVGYFPRSLAAGYVRIRSNTRYQFYRALSPSELRSLVGLRQDVRVGPAPIPPPSGAASSVQLNLGRAYRKLASFGAAGRLIRPIGPLLEVVGRIDPAAPMV